MPKPTSLISISFQRVTPEPVRLLKPDIYMTIIENKPSIYNISPFLPFMPPAGHEYGIPVIATETTDCGATQSLKLHGHERLGGMDDHKGPVSRTVSDSGGDEEGGIWICEE